MAATSSDAALCAAAVALLLLTRVAAGVPLQGDPFDLTESLNGDFSAEGFGAKWINGTALYYNKDGEMVIKDVSTNVTKTVLPRDRMEQFQPDSTKLSADGRFILLSYDSRKVYRHSSLSFYVIYNIADNTTIEVRSGERLQLAKWAPVGSALAYVYNNNIYYLSQLEGDAVQVTSDGVPGVIYNGVADWVNEEEVLSTDTAMWWSPDGSKLAFARYDDTLVHNASFMHYGSPGVITDQYATITTIRYPKAGTTNPTVELKVATLGETVTVQQMTAPTDVVSSDHILDVVQWASPNVLLAAWSNRVANTKQFVIYSPTGTADPVVGEQGLQLQQQNGWLEPASVYFKEGNNATYLTITWEDQGGADSFPHVVAVTGGSKKPLTSGPITITAIYGWAPNGTVYYEATEEGQPSRRHVYAIEEGGTPRCLSCNISSPEGNTCRSASASFSTDFSWYALTCSGPDPDIVILCSTAPSNVMDTIIWQDNADLRRKLFGKKLPEAVDDWVDVPGGLRAQVRLWLPPGLDTSGSEKRPAIVNVYGGPGSQQITDSYGVGFQHYITTSRRYIYILIDGRGSDCKGNRTLFAVNRRLGSYEIEDQINVTRQLKEKYPFIDGARIAIWGWSYGGYATAMVMAQDRENVFKCGASVAPVTSWIYYDSIYTERYMGLPTPEDNEAGYNTSDVTRVAACFGNKTFLLMHGTGDDNVHYQQSMMLARALEDAGVLFRQQSYPDQDHSMGELRNHLYRTLDDFFGDCFDCQTQAVSSAARASGGLLAVAPIAKYVL